MTYKRHEQVEVFYPDNRPPETGMILTIEDFEDYEYNRFNNQQELIQFDNPPHQAWIDQRWIRRITSES